MQCPRRAPRPLPVVHTDEFDLRPARVPARPLRLVAWSLALIAATGLVGCWAAGSPPLTIEEARRVAVVLRGSPLELPPRSLVGLGELPEELAAVDAEPDCGEASKPLDVNRLRQQQASVEIWRGASQDSLRRSAQLEFFSGQMSRAVTLQRLAVEMTPQEWWGVLGGNKVFLGMYLAHAGDFRAARGEFIGGYRLLSDVLPGHPDESCRLRFLYWLRRAEGAIAFSQGDMDAAQRYLIESFRALERLKRARGTCRLDAEEWRRTDIAVWLAQAMLWQGRLVEAESLARWTINKQWGLVSPALIYTTLSEIFIEGRRFQDSLRTGLAALQFHKRACTPTDSYFRGRTLEVLARALIALGRWEEAARQFEALEAGLRADPETWERRFRANADRGLVLVQLRRPADALPVLDLAVDQNRNQFGDDYYGTMEAVAIRAVARADLGRHAEAREELTRTLPRLLIHWRQRDGASPVGGGRAQKLAWIIERYLELLLAPPDATRQPAMVAEAFQIADALRTREVHRALAESAARHFSGDPELAETIRQRQDLERQLSALRYRLRDLEAFAVSRDQKQVVGTLQGEIDQVRGALAALDAEIQRRFPKYAELSNPKPVSPADAQRLLAPDEALVALFVGHGRSYVWAVPPSGPVEAAVVPLGAEAVETMVTRVRAALEPTARTVQGIPLVDLDAAWTLYRAFLEPVRAAWRDARSLLIAPHGALERLPFAILPMRPAAFGAAREPLFAEYREVPWLIRRYAVTVLPSVASLKTLRELGPGAPSREPFVGFADPYFTPEQVAPAERVPGPESVTRGVQPAPPDLPLHVRARPDTQELDSAQLAQLPRLPETAEEVLDIARALGADPTRAVFTGRRATEQQVKTMDLSRYRVLAFATHGLVPGDLDGLLEPALALSSPAVVGGEDDGLLTTGEVLGLRINADWVVLSACNTAAARGAGAEAVSGLGRAFFYAGARALLVSHWPVETTSARALITELFRRQQTQPHLGRAWALQQTLNWMIDEAVFVDRRTGQTAFSYAHPLFWGPFTLVGDGGGPRSVR